MSRYEWQKGEVKIPSAEWVKVRKKLIEAWNRLTTGRYELAVRLHAHLKTVSKGKRKFDFLAESQKWLSASATSRWDHDDEDDSLHYLSNAVITRLEDGRCKLRAPLKADFPQAKSTQRTFKHPPYGYWSGQVSLNDETRTLHWNVEENNHAVDHAWKHPLGRNLSLILNEIKWTRGTGGVFLQNDEYNRDAAKDFAEGGGSYIGKAFGPLGEKEREYLIRGALRRR